LLADCHGLICHGGHGTIAASLAAGVPVLSLPLHVENWINGSRLAATGAGLMPATGTKAPDFMALLNRLVSDSALRHRASEIAACHAPQDRVRQVVDAVERIEGCSSKTQMVTGEMH
jgi:UDP:flavonoid glycosyltransferase YjiC (YdhE family)